MLYSNLAISIMQPIFDLPHTGFIALAGLAMGGWLTLLTHRLPRMMEREWQAHCPNTDHHPAAAYGLHASVSYCLQCEAPVTGWRQLPLVSWLLLKGRCAVCGVAIGWRYPAIEMLTAALFAACAWRFGPTPLALYAMALSAALAWIDLESRLLPNALTLPLIWAGLLINLGDSFTPLPLAVLGAMVGYGFLWVIFHAWRLCTRKDGMDHADPELAHGLKSLYDPIRRTDSKVRSVILPGHLHRSVYRLTLAGVAVLLQPITPGSVLVL